VDLDCAGLNIIGGKMSTQDRVSSAKLERQAWNALNQAVRDLETAWRDHRPDLNEFVPDASNPLRNTHLVELIKVDQELSWGSGECRLLESYLSEWPELSSIEGVCTELLEAECLNRFVSGQSPQLTELGERFPEAVQDIDLSAIEERCRRDASVRAEDPETPDVWSSAADLVPGQTVGRYDIRECLGNGSMGAVYHAWDTRLQRDVALKIPHLNPAADPDLADQFRREAVAMAQVHHPSVCPVYDSFEFNGRLALTMAFVKGETLTDWVKQRRLTQQQIAELTLQIARGLDAIHERGVIHRDVKPDNIIVDRKGRPIVTDFGIAVSSKEQVASNDLDSFSGTPAYMSPEQIDGPNEIDHRSDVYSLGVLLFQTLTGSLPFVGDLASVLDNVRTQPTPEPSERCPKLDRSIELICLKAMEKQPQDRFESAEKMAVALERSLHNLRHRRQKKIRRTSAVLGSVIVALVAIFAFYLLRQPPASDEDIMLLAQYRRKLTVAGSRSSGRALVALPDARLLVASDQSGFAPFRFFDPKTETDGAEFSFTIPIQYYNDEEGFTAPRHTHYGATMSRDGRFLFCTDYYANCIVRLDLESKQPDHSAVFLPIEHRWAHAIAITPDGKRLVTATGRDQQARENNSIVVVDVDGDKFRLLDEVNLPDEVTGTVISFRADSQFAYVVTKPIKSNAPVLYEVSLQEPYEITRRLSFPGSQIADMAILSGSNDIVVSDIVRRTIRIVDGKSFADTGREFQLYGHVPGPLALNAAGDVLYVLCPEARKLVCLNPKSGEVLGGAHDLPADVQRLLLSPDDSQIWTVHPRGVVAEFQTDDLFARIAFASNRGGSHQIHAMTPDGKSILKLSKGSHVERCPRWSPEGQRIAFISNRAGPNRICIMNRAGDGVRVLHETDPVVGEQQEVPLDWSPDGTQIAFVGADHKAIRIVNVDSGRIRTLLNGPTEPTQGHVYDCHNGLSWSPVDGTIVFNSQEKSYGFNQDILRLDPATGKVTSVTDLWDQKRHFIAPAAASNRASVAAIQIDPIGKRMPPRRICLVTESPVRFLTEPMRNVVYTPCWFPSGLDLVYSQGVLGQHQLFVVSVLTGEMRPITNPRSDSRDPDVWSSR
jgi:serine/threonine protein kinase/Tol biopolymer transport system component